MSAAPPDAKPAPGPGPSEIAAAPDAAVTPAFARTISIVAVIWIAVMAVVALIAGGAGALAVEGWRLTLLQAAGIIGFAAMSIAGGAAAIALEARRGR